MATVVGYERPATGAEALALLSRPGSVVLGGGTKLNAFRTAEPAVVVDLQALGLDGIDPLGTGAFSLGATATLQRLVDHPELPEALREAARREQPSTLRAAATVGGCVATGDPESELLAVLLACDARVSIAGGDDVRAPSLDELLDDRGVLARRFVSAVTVETEGSFGVARVARTRADRPIVAAVARRTPAGELRLALAGVATRPLLVESIDEVDGLGPPGDFRGSSEYRRALAVTLAGRVLEEVT